MIAALSFAFGAVLFWAPSSSPASSSSQESAASGGQVASADGASQEGDGGLLGTAGHKVSTQYDSSVYIMKNKAGDLIGDNAVDATNEAVAPGVEAASHAVASVLPSSIAHYVPWLAGAAMYKVEGNAKESLGNVVEDNFQAAADAVKPGGGSGTGGAPVASPGGATSAASIPDGTGKAEGGASAASSAAATSAAASGMVTPAAWGGERWTIRLGRFATAANADTFASEISRRGVPARVAVASDGGRYWSFVQSGSYEGRGAAEMALRDLQARGYGGSIVSEGGSGF